jgi:hypothetical protein
MYIPFPTLLLFLITPVTFYHYSIHGMGTKEGVKHTKTTWAFLRRKGRGFLFFLTTHII